MTRMIRHRTFTSLLLAAAAGAVLAVLLGLLTPGPADPVVPEAPRSLRLPSGRVVPVHAVSTGRDGQLDVPDNPRSAGWWRGSSRVGDPSGKHLPGRPHRLAAPAAGTLRRTVRCATRAPAGAAVGRPSSGLPHPLGAADPAGVPDRPPRPVLTQRHAPTCPRHVRATVRPDARGLPEPRRPRGQAQRSGDSHGHPMSGPKKKPPTTTKEPRTAGPGPPRARQTRRPGPVISVGSREFDGHLGRKLGTPQRGSGRLTGRPDLPPQRLTLQAATGSIKRRAATRVYPPRSGALVYRICR